MKSDIQFFFVKKKERKKRKEIRGFELQNYVNYI